MPPRNRLTKRPPHARASPCANQRANALRDLGRAPSAGAGVKAAAAVLAS